MRAITTSCILTLAFLLSGVESAATQWPMWRGPDGTGIVESGNPPLEWSETKNIKWKAALPGVGLSTPIVWKDRIILLTAIPVGTDEGKARGAFYGFGPETKSVTVPYQFVVLAVDRSSGEILWQTKVREALPHQGHHPTGSLASYSPVTDGTHIWASFGSRGLYCLDMDGAIVWQAELPEMKKSGAFGESSSPALVDGHVIVLCDHEGQSKIIAFHQDTGELAWERDRDEISSWSSPVPVEVDGRWQVITSAARFIRSYDVRTGELVWKCSGLTDCPAPSPVIHDNKVYCTTGFRGESTMAIELGRTGDLSDSDAIVWSTRSNGSNVPTPLIHDGRIYVFQGYRGRLSCYDAATGEVYYEKERLVGVKDVYASPIAVGDHIIMPTRNGKTLILSAGDELDVVATNDLDESLDGSPVVIGDTLFLRGRSHLYCIASPEA